MFLDLVCVKNTVNLEIHVRVWKSSQDSKIGLSSLAEMNRLADQIFQNESATKIPRYSQPNRALVKSHQVMTRVTNEEY